MNVNKLPPSFTIDNFILFYTPMERIVQDTADGSPTIAIPDMQVTYHSRYGAIQESRHVFIQAGLQPLLKQHNILRVFEMGFGTGLNALLTLEQAITQEQCIYYHAVEKYPLQDDEIKQLNYTQILPYEYFTTLHQCNWDEPVAILPFFTFYKSLISLQEFKAEAPFHLVYYDAFAPAAQPELWTQQIFEQLYALLMDGGVLVTYCSKGEVRRNMLASGLKVEKLAGPPGKREMLRATKY
jgi:tRNA U34 5-methylaminomethyl-2-thiouridine-forming methyltransferase MnmC